MGSCFGGSASKGKFPVCWQLLLSVVLCPQPIPCAPLLEGAHRLRLLGTPPAPSEEGGGAGPCVDEEGAAPGPAASWRHSDQVARATWPVAQDLMPANLKSLIKWAEIPAPQLPSRVTPGKSRNLSDVSFLICKVEVICGQLDLFPIYTPQPLSIPWGALPRAVNGLSITCNQIES